jgi:hypothetical protein
MAAPPTERPSAEGAWTVSRSSGTGRARRNTVDRCRHASPMTADCAIRPLSTSLREQTIATPGEA